MQNVGDEERIAPFTALLPSYKGSHFMSENTAERILQFADREITGLPDSQQEETLLYVQRELNTWLEAICAGKQFKR